MEKKCKRKCFPPVSISKIVLGIKLLTIFILTSAVTATARTFTEHPLPTNKVASITIINPAEQQKKVVSGKVKDSQGLPLPGVTVVVKGTTTGVITDNEGNYSLSNITANTALQFSFVGMKSQEVIVDKNTAINIVLLEESIGIEEVVSIGYGIQKKSDLTGSIARVSMEEKAIQGNLNLSQALVGASAGVNLEGRGGADGEATLSIRGQTSLSASGSPLIVLDGVIYNGSISTINTADIESIDVLKDASSAAVYGSRSANGVLLITTKKGKSKKPVVSFDMYKGFQDMTNNPMRVMNGDEFATRLLDWSWESNVYNWYKTNPTSVVGRPIRPDASNRDVVASYLRTLEEKQNYLAGNQIDWVKEVLQIAPMQNYNFSVQGMADEKTSYYLSASYTNVEGIQLNDKFSRITIHSNVQSKVNEWITLGLNASYSSMDYSGIPASLYNARIASPLVNNHIGTPNYDIFLGGEQLQAYPLVGLYTQNSDIRKELFAVASAKITIPWVKGLNYELSYSNVNNTTNNKTFSNSNTPAGAANGGYASKNPTQEQDWILNNIVNYSKSLGNHQLNATLLFSREGRTGDASSLIAQGFDNESLGYNNMGLGKIASISSSAFEENSLSYMARLNYSYLSRYMLTATIRRDGFSGFGAGNKWATFPSASLAWVASNESFLKDKGLYLKLRTSYGVNGNQGIGRYSSLSRMGIYNYVYGQTTAIGLFPSTLANSNLGWETTSSFNVGVDFGVLKNRITGTIDVYTAKTSNVLVQRQLPSTTGYQSVWSNIGGISNKGIEVELKSINLNGALKWETNFVFSLNRDEITKLYGGNNDKDIGNAWFVGESISALYDYQSTGRVWTEEELFTGKILKGWYPGQFKYVDQNNDGVIEPVNDRKVIGYESPSYRFSVNNAFTYKNFSLTIFINSIQGGKNHYMANNAQMINPLFYMQERTNNSAINNYWRPDVPTTNTTGIYNLPIQQSGIYQSRSFVRLQDVSLAYKFGQRFLDKMSLKSCQIYISSKNPYVWTKWQGWDPEIGVSDTPLTRSVILGLRLSF